jgi:hypothetical protein
MDNVIYLERAFEVHTWLLDCLLASLECAVAQGLMRPSKCRELKEAAQRAGISQLRCMAEAAEHLLAA